MSQLIKTIIFRKGTTLVNAYYKKLFDIILLNGKYIEHVDHCFVDGSAS